MEGKQRQKHLVQEVVDRTGASCVPRVFRERRPALLYRYEIQHNNELRKLIPLCHHGRVEVFVLTFLINLGRNAKKPGPSLVPNNLTTSEIWWHIIF